MKEIVRIEVPSFIRRVKVSEKRRAKYYMWGDKLPKKYKKDDNYLKDGYRWQARTLVEPTYLVDDKDNKIIKNTKTVGTPKYYLINGQDLYNGTIQPQLRAKVVEEIKKDFRKHLDGIVPITTFPIGVKCYMYDYLYDSELKTRNWDVDNRFFGFYGKSFSDLLKAEGIIPDDKAQYITTPPYVTFREITEGERKLVFIIYQDEDSKVS